MKLQLNYSTGAVTLNDAVLLFPGMRVEEMVSSLFKGIVSSRLQKKKSIFFRFDSDIQWENHAIESVVAEFNVDKCREVVIHLLPSSIGTVNSVMDLELVASIRKHIKSPEHFEGRSKAVFSCAWGSIDVLYDIKVSAASVRLIYA